MAQNTPSSSEIALSNQLAKIDQQIKLITALTPQNLKQEHDAFFKGQITNPQFEYAAPHTNYAGLLKKIKSLKFPRTIVGDLLHDQAQQIAAKIELLMSIGQRQFTQKSINLYGLPDEQTIKYAQKMVAETPATDKSAGHDAVHLDYTTVIKHLKEVLHKYGLDNWQVEPSKNIVAGILIATHRKTVLVHQNTFLEISRLGPIITHEIETHVLTYMNGAAQPLALFKQGMANYLKTQEGLAAYNVAQQYPQVKRPLKFWARNTLAVNLARKAPFYQVFNAIRELGFEDHMAFGVTTKVKRGLSDTGQAGGFTKDYVYLAGKLAVEKYIQSGGSLTDLYVGKVDVHKMERLKKLRWLRPAKLLPFFLR